MLDIVELLDKILNSEKLFLNFKNTFDFLEDSREQNLNDLLDKVLADNEGIFAGLLKGFNNVAGNNLNFVQKNVAYDKNDFFNKTISNSNVFKNIARLQKDGDIKNINKISNIDNSSSIFNFLKNEGGVKNESFTTESLKFDDSEQLNGGLLTNRGENNLQINNTNSFNVNFGQIGENSESLIDSLGSRFSKLFVEAVKNRAFDSGY